jgi:hypothetical protein
MKKNLIAIGLVIGAAIGGQFAWAALQSRLPGHATSTKFAGVSWDTTGAFLFSNDDGTTGNALDPSGPGTTAAATPRNTYDVGSTAAPTVVGGVLTINVQNAYAGYEVTVMNASNSHAGFVVQNVEVIPDTPVPSGYDTMLASDVTARLSPVATNPGGCDAPVGDQIPIDLTFNTTGKFSFAVNVITVPSTAYVSGSCLHW